MEFKFTSDRNSYRRMTTDELRDAYLVNDMFRPGEVTLCYTDVDRAIVGSIVPVESALSLPTHKELASDFFAQRREAGAILQNGFRLSNVGAKFLPALAVGECRHGPGRAMYTPAGGDSLPSRYSFNVCPFSTTRLWGSAPA